MGHARFPAVVMLSVQLRRGLSSQPVKLELKL